MSTFKKRINSILLKLFQNMEKEGGPLLNFIKISIILIPFKKSDKNTLKKENLKTNYNIKYGSKSNIKYYSKLTKTIYSKNNTMCPGSINSRCARIVQYYEIINLIHHGNRSKQKRLVNILKDKKKTL